MRPTGETDLRVNVVHPGNPFSADPDGIVSVQRNFISAAPPGFSFDYWGVGRPGVGAPAGGRTRFHEVGSSSTQRPLVPLSLAFGADLIRRRNALRAGVIRLDRIESAVPLWGLRAPKALFLHTWNVRDVRDDATESRWRRIAPVYDVLFDRIVRSMDAVYVLRPDMAEDLRDRMPAMASRVHAFGVPVDIEVFRPLTADETAEERRALQTAAGVPARARLVLFAGRLEGQKRPLVIPEVAARLASDGREEVHVLIVGAGTLEGELRATMERIAPTQVHLIPPVPQTELRRLMAASDGLLLPSAFEGLPNVVLESLACGTPVVAARAPGRVADILTDPRLGAVVDPSAEGLAAGIREAMSCGAEGVAQRRSVAERFSPAAMNAPIYADFERLARTA